MQQHAVILKVGMPAAVSVLSIAVAESAQVEMNMFLEAVDANKKSTFEERGFITSIAITASHSCEDSKE